MKKFIINTYWLLKFPKFQKQIDNFHVGALIPHFIKITSSINPLHAKMKIIKRIGDFYFNISKKNEINNK